MPILLQRAVILAAVLVLRERHEETVEHISSDTGSSDLTQGETDRFREGATWSR